MVNVEKNISHMNVLDVFEKSKTCPLCDLNNATVSKYIDDMLYENVNDIGLRKKLAARKGFCSFHGELLLKHGDALGIAIIHIDQIQLLLNHLKNAGNILSFLKGPEHGDWTGHSNCLICEIRIEAEKRHIETFIELIDDNALRSYLDSSDGFCARHLLMVLAKLKNKGHATYLLELHTRKYASLLADLKEFCRKNDYRFKDEHIGQEADSWEKAVHIVSGKIL